MPDDSSVVSPNRNNRSRWNLLFLDPETGLFTTYANNVQLGWTHFDVRMIFGEVVDAQTDKLIVEQRAQCEHPLLPSRPRFSCFYLAKR